jgi:hypothetical protein
MGKHLQNQNITITPKRARLKALQMNELCRKFIPRCERLLYFFMENTYAEFTPDGGDHVVGHPPSMTAASSAEL